MSNKVVYPYAINKNYTQNGKTGIKILTTNINKKFTKKEIDKLIKEGFTILEPNLMKVTKI